MLTLSVSLMVSLLLSIWLPFLPFFSSAGDLLGCQQVQQLLHSLWSCRRILRLHTFTQ